MIKMSEKGSEKESKMVRISILVESEDKAELWKICKQFDTDISHFLRKVIKQVIS